MGEPILNLADASSWQQIYNETFVGEPTNIRPGWFPIPAFVVPILLHSPYVAIAASSDDAASNWRFGFFARQFISPAAVGVGSLESYAVKAFLNRAVIAKFKMFSAQYQLRIEIPWWHKSMSVAIWEYVGPIDDTSDKLVRDTTDVIRIDLLRIEQKIDNL